MKLSESIPLLRDGADPSVEKGGDLSAFIVLTLVIFIVALALVWRRNRGSVPGAGGKGVVPPDSWSRWFVGGRRSSVKVLGTVHLPGKHSLHEVEWQGKLLLIGCSAQSIQLLVEQPLVNISGEDSNS